MRFQLVLLNERVRMLEYHDKPGDKTSRQMRREFVPRPERRAAPQ